MSTREFLILLLQYFFGILAYSGPFIPLAVTLLFRKASAEHFRRNVWLLIVLTTIQAASYLPYILALRAEEPDSLYGLLLPFGLGALSFLATLPYCIAECFHLRRKSNRKL
jgi:hypothetical protein